MSRAHATPDNALSPIVHVGAGTVRLRVRGSREPNPAAEPPRVSPYGRWRALVLASVYLLMGLHIAHWKLNGTTLAPLELNEVMHTLELGIVTAGFLFMLVAFLGTLVFGRFFCSWACHILALEDACAWMLEKLGIRPKPLRSRVLLLVPSVAFLYMFVWPHIKRIIERRPAPEIRVLSEGEGWASFVTSDFWRNLPDPWIAALTFAVCGFAVVYFLGSRSFCRYACPYGAAFAFADRLAPGRIKLTGQCEQCGQCTAVCSSQVRVHEEIARFGMVVDTSCMKDLDCVGTCPHEAITFGFARPALLRSFSRTGRRRLRSDFSVGEEVLIAVTFGVTILVFRGLYDAVPFLLTLGLAGILAYATILLVRLIRRPDVRFNQFQLRRAGSLTPAGRVCAVAGAAMIGFVAHSAFVRYHEWTGRRAYVAARVSQRPAPDDIRAALAHLETCDRWGLFRPISLHEALADLHLMADAPRRAAPHLAAIVERRPDYLRARLTLAKVYGVTERPDLARAEAERVVELGAATSNDDPHIVHIRVEAHQMLAQHDAEAGQLDDAASHLGAVVDLMPDSPVAHFTLGLMAERRGELDKAATHYRAATRLDPTYGPVGRAP